eukprot:GFKZ01010723.1.p1 GENE.GFKZ01010723.1~~GFKZ01010723.1.p1  ORF type:complete len:517 (+),score=56.16 GFKZ01010723.1:234-1784(+)
MTRSYSYKVGDPVWAIMEGYPWWPGKVISPQQAVLDPGEVLPSIPLGSFIIEFFNDEKRFSIVTKSKLRPFQNRRFINLTLSYKGSHRNSLNKAIQEANQYMTSNGFQYVGAAKKAKNANTAKTTKTATAASTTKTAKTASTTNTANTTKTATTATTANTANTAKAANTATTTGNVKKRKQNPEASSEVARVVRPKIRGREQGMNTGKPITSSSNGTPAPSNPVPDLSPRSQLNGRRLGASAHSTPQSTRLRNSIPTGSSSAARTPTSVRRSNRRRSAPSTGINPIASPELRGVQLNGTLASPPSAKLANQIKSDPSPRMTHVAPSPSMQQVPHSHLRTNANHVALGNGGHVGATGNEISVLREMSQSGELSNERLYASESKSTLIYLVSEYEKELRFFRLTGLQRAAQSTGVVSEVEDFIWICAPAFAEVKDFITMSENAADNGSRDMAAAKALEKLRKLSNMPILPSLLRSQHSVMRRGIKLAAEAVPYSKTVAVFMRNLCIQWLDIAGGPNPS